MTKLLLDTHTLIWAAFMPDLIPGYSRSLIEAPGNRVFVSSISAFEISTKFNLGKLAEARTLAFAFRRQMAENQIEVLDITADHCERAGHLPFHHNDPWDRLIIAQALTDDLLILSKDEEFDKYGVERFWKRPLRRKD
ncbi:MAG: type II toxin-antitoxin system VapC family toxin [Pseudomonadota bacterium]